MPASTTSFFCRFFCILESVLKKMKHWHFTRIALGAILDKIKVVKFIEYCPRAEILDENKNPKFFPYHITRS